MASWPSSCTPVAIPDSQDLLAHHTKDMPHMLLPTNHTCKQFLASKNSGESTNFPCTTMQVSIGEWKHPTGPCLSRDKFEAAGQAHTQTGVNLTLHFTVPRQILTHVPAQLGNALCQRALRLLSQSRTGGTLQLGPLMAPSHNTSSHRVRLYTCKSRNPFL
jgi:hypothetical protein